MRKRSTRLIGFLLCLIAVLSVFSLPLQLAAADESFREETAYQIYINDVLMQSRIYSKQNQNMFDTEEIMLPLRSLLETMGYTVEWREPNVVVVYAADGNNICIFLQEDGFEYAYFQGDVDAFLEEPYEIIIPKEYLNIDGSVYCFLTDLYNIFHFYVYQDRNKIYLDTGDYHQKYHTLYDFIGRETTYEVYINDTKIETPVYIDNFALDGWMVYYYVALRPVFETIGAEISFLPPNTVLITYNGTTYTFRAGKTFANGEETLYADGERDCCIVNGTTYIALSEIRYLIDGSLKTSGIRYQYLYTADFVREDIPADLQAAYKQLDAVLEQEDIAFIKNSSEKDRLLMHFGLGLWIRNEWIYPTNDRIAKVFLEKDIREPDEMSAYIIDGYYLYLNGLPCAIDDIVATEKQ